MISPIVLEAKISGRVFTDWTSVSVQRSLDGFLGSFSFTATDRGFSDFPVKEGDRIIVSIDGNTLMTGTIDEDTISYDSGSHSVSFVGRDITRDLVDSTVTGNMKLASPISLKSVTQKVLDNLNLGYSVSVPLGIKNFYKGEMASAEVGGNAFGYIEKYARKRQLILQTTTDGDIEFLRAGRNETLYVLDNSVIKSASRTSKGNTRYNKYIIRSQSNFSSGAPVASSVSGVVTDFEVDEGRVMDIVENTSSSIETATQRAKWESNIRRARAFTYSCVVQGFYANGSKELWAPNMIVKVSDKFARIDARLLIKSVSFSFTVEGGSLTTLTLCDKDAYTLQATRDLKEALFERISK